jgi:hypothetical protein
MYQRVSSELVVDSLLTAEHPLGSTGLEHGHSKLGNRKQPSIVQHSCSVLGSIRVQASVWNPAIITMVYVVFLSLPYHMSGHHFKLQYDSSFRVI